MNEPVPPQTPVDEVVLSFAFEPEPAVVGPLIPDLLGQDLWRQFPKVEVAPPYQMPVEFEPLVPNIFSNVIDFVMAAANTRHWLISSDDTRVLQLQHDYVALNWRRRGDAPYVKYQQLRKEFMEIVERLGAGLAERGSALRPVRAEITYINLIQADDSWRQALDTEAVFALSLPPIGDVDNVAVSLSSSLTQGDRWAGRMHVKIGGARVLETNVPALNLNLTARSGDFEGRSVEQAFAFLDYAHDEVNKTFSNLLTPATRAKWGWDA